MTKKIKKWKIKTILQREEILNYKGRKHLYRTKHIKDKSGFCQAGHYDDTLCGERIITASGIPGFGILWEIKEEKKRKPMCKECLKIRRIK